jgi:hypothetical protein
MVYAYGFLLLAGLKMKEKQEQITIAIAGRFNGGNAVCLK